MIIKKIPWTRKPQATVLVNKSHPLARGLVYFWYFPKTDRAAWNAVTGISYDNSVDSFYYINRPTSPYMTRAVDPVEGRIIRSNTSGAGTKLVPDNMVLRNPSTWLCRGYYNSASVDQPMVHLGGSVNAANTMLLWLRDDGTGTMAPYINSGASQSGSYLVPPNKWTTWGASITGTSTSPTAAFYVNGKFDANSGDFGTLTDGTSVEGIFFSRAGNSVPMDGKISFVAVWNRALTAAEHAAFYANPWQILEPRTVYVPTYTAPATAPATTSGLIARKIPRTWKPNLPATPRESGKYPPVHAGWVFEAGGLKNFGKAKLNTVYQVTAGAITTSKYGRCMEFTAVDQGVNLDADQTKVFPTAPTLTVLIHSIKTDTTLRANCAFAANTGGDDTKQCKVHLAYTNGTTYFDFGGTSVGGGSRVTLASSNYTDSVWAFTVGSRGMEIWQDGVRKALNSVAPVTRNASSALAATIGNNDIVDGDLVKVPALFIWHKQLSMAELAALTRSRTAYLDIFAPRTQRIPFSDGAAAGGPTNYDVDVYFSTDAGSAFWAKADGYGLILPAHIAGDAMGGEAGALGSLSFSTLAGDTQAAIASAASAISLAVGASDLELGSASASGAVDDSIGAGADPGGQAGGVGAIELATVASAAQAALSAAIGAIEAGTANGEAWAGQASALAALLQGAVTSDLYAYPLIGSQDGLIGDYTSSAGDVETGVAVTLAAMLGDSVAGQILAGVAAVRDAIGGDSTTGATFLEAAGALGALIAQSRASAVVTAITQAAGSLTAKATAGAIFTATTPTSSTEVYSLIASVTIYAALDGSIATYPELSGKPTIH